MENWLKIHEFITDNEVIMVILTYAVAEVLKRIIPTKSKESIMELSGKLVRFLLDKTKLPNKVKESDGDVVDKNPKNHETKENV